MKTKEYNPSPLEVALANIVNDLSDEIQSRLTDCNITSIIKRDQLDNPQLIYTVEDADGDEHELVLEFIQRPDVSLGAVKRTASAAVPENMKFSVRQH